MISFLKDFKDVLSFGYIFRLYKILPFGVTVYNPKTTRFEYVNYSMIQQTGYSRKELLKKPAHKYAIDFERTDNEIKQVATKETLKAMKNPRHFVNYWKTKDGDRIEMSWISVSMGSKIVSIVSIRKDDVN